MSDELSLDRAGKEYWDDLWADSRMPDPIDPRKPGLRNFVTREFHALFQRLFASVDTQSSTLLEVGCARSTWLPYFARELGFKVAGLDYSEIGCEQELQILSKSGVEAPVVCADLFDPPAELLASFDVVVTFGVVEHFKDTGLCVSALAALVKPGGLLITEVPNMNGAVGWAQKLMDKSVYMIHVPLDSRQLRNAHEKAGLDVLECNYFLGANFGLINRSGMNQGGVAQKLKSLFFRLLMAFSFSTWALDSCGLRIPRSKLLSPYLICAARKTG